MLQNEKKHGWISYLADNNKSTSIILGRAFIGIQKPRHCGGVKKSLSGEQRKEAPNVIIY